MSAIIVSDTSVVNLLVRVGQIHLLGQLYQQILVVPEVVAELNNPLAGNSVNQWIQNPPVWLRIEAPTTIPLAVNLDAGELASIALAIERSLPILIDERLGRLYATAAGLKVMGTIGLLEDAANQGLIADLAVVHRSIRGERFHIADSILNESLRRHQLIRNPPTV